MAINPNYFHIRYKLFQLDADTIQQLTSEAEAGDKDAQYAIGRYMYVVRPEEDSIDHAFHYFEKAYAQGQLDAAAALSIIYEEGCCCPIDSIKCNKLLDESLKGGSYFALISYAYALISGTLFFKKDLDKALELINKAIDSSAVDGELLGYLLYLKAWAKQDRKDDDFSPEHYAEAIKHGCTCAWRYYADTMCIGEDKEIKDETEYRRILQDGIEAGDCESMTMYTYLQSMSAEEDNTDGEKFIASFEKAFKLGSTTAAYLIAQTYYNGWDGVEMSVEKAWEWYLKGAHYNNIDCLEAMYEMCHVTHDIDLPLEQVDTIALVGARFGSIKLLGRTVISYSEGRLTKYAAEIEKYYEPIFDAEEEADFDDIYDNDEPDDDGRFDAYA